jgi:uncharacterized protein
MKTALLDVNVLVALFNVDHTLHDIAHDWFADNRESGWATCPLTENGMLRILGNPSNRSNFAPIPELADRLRTLCSGAGHHFWNDSLSLRDEKRFNLAHMRGCRQLTDVYLLGLAVARDGRLVTFDHRISLDAVKGARREHLDVVSAAA